jgi:hypothetical protein
VKPDQQARGPVAAKATHSSPRPSQRFRVCPQALGELRASQLPVAYFYGARSVVFSLGHRRAQRSSFARPTRAVPPLLRRLPGGYRA